MAKEGRWVTVMGRKVFLEKAGNSNKNKVSPRSKSGKTAKNVPNSKVKNGKTGRGVSSGGKKSGKSGYRTNKK